MTTSIFGTLKGISSDSRHARQSSRHPDRARRDFNHSSTQTSSSYAKGCPFWTGARYIGPVVHVKCVLDTTSHYTKYQILLISLKR